MISFWASVAGFGSLRPTHLTEHYLTTPLDHAALGNSRTFQLRYLLGTSDFAAGGPLIVYTGNEAPVTDFSSPEAAGLLFTMARQWGGAVAFVEERYYGLSIPEQQPGEAPFAYLSSVQVVADHVLAVAALRRKLNASQVLAVGGSYGGMLSAWLRKRHPDLVSAALSSSAPMLGYAATLVARDTADGFYRIVESAYSCRDAIGAAFRAVWAAAPAAWQQMSSDFGLCTSSSVDGVPSKEALIGFLQLQLSDLAYANYPTPSSFLGKKLPAYPVDFACSKVAPVAESRAPWMPLVDALSWSPYYPTSPYHPPGGCIALEIKFGTAPYTPGFLPGAWTFQRCSDLVMTFSVGAASRMFLPCDEGFTANCQARGMRDTVAFCAATFGVAVPRSEALQDYWGGDWSTKAGGRKILFSNGDLDPWSYAAVPDSIHDDDGPVLLHIPGGAHHIDLRASHPTDPPEITAARAKEIEVLGQWLGL